MVSRDEVPGGLEDLTPSWLTAALRENGLLQAPGRVASAQVTPLGADRGFTGVIARASLHYRDAGGSPPCSLVAKLPTALPGTPSAYRERQQADPAAVERHYQRCAREVTCYRELGVAGGMAPRCYYAAADPDRLRVALLLEDLSHGSEGDTLAGGTVARARAVLDAVAPLHAQAWQGPAPGWLPWFVTDPAANQQRYAARVGPFLERYGATLPDGVVALVRRLRGTYAAVLTELAQAPQTVIHGELHLDNLVFFDEPGAARPVVLLDWQSVRGGPAADDVAVVMHHLPPAARAAAETDLLGRYAARLRAAGVADYPVARLRHHYRLALQHQLAGVVGWLAASDPDRLAGRERALVEAALGDGRLIAALHHHQLI